ncbi:MAG: hypothetical protein JNG89_07630 [Planctomycetaceae bacterium]|nr:hypothetical protein [Planctomycetaceae bacterium]
MSHDPRPNDARELSDLVDSPQPGLTAEFWQFLKTNKKWWLLPLLLALLALGALAVLGGTTLSPFIYPFL